MTTDSFGAGLGRRLSQRLAHGVNHSCDRRGERPGIANAGCSLVAAAAELGGDLVDVECRATAQADFGFLRPKLEKEQRHFTRRRRSSKRLMTSSVSVASAPLGQVGLRCRGKQSAAEVGFDVTQNAALQLEASERVVS